MVARSVLSHSHRTRPLGVKNIEKYARVFTPLPNAWDIGRYPLMRLRCCFEHKSNQSINISGRK